MNYRGHNFFLLLLFGVMLGGACQQQPPSSSTSVAAAIVTSILPTQPPTSTDAAATPILLPLTQTPTPSPAPESLTPTAATSILLLDFLGELKVAGYILQENSLPLSLGETTYMAYLLNLPMMNPFDETYTGESGKEACRLVISRTDGENEVVVATFDAPQYPTGSYLFPHGCSLINWDGQKELVFSDDGLIAAATPELMNLNQYWSDINQNGLPEFAVYYFACRMGCRDASTTTHFYEIQSEAAITDITADLPGMLLPWRLTHNDNPLELFVYDPQGEYEIHEYFHMWWIFAWDGAQYVDVTSLYSDEVRAWGEENAQSIQQRYGQPLLYGYPTQLLSLLLQYDRVGLRNEGVELFLTLTDPINWPETDSGLMCWLQTIRYYVQLDAEQGNPFRLPPQPSSELYWADPCVIPERSS